MNKPPKRDSARPLTSLGTTIAIYEWREMLHSAKLTPARMRDASKDVRFVDSPDQTAAIPNRVTPVSMVALSPKRVTRMPAGTSNTIVPR